MKLGELEFSEFVRNVTRWGERVGIYDESSWQKQLEKFGEERMELFTAETDLELMDSFGDQMVCLVHCQNFSVKTRKLKANVWCSELERHLDNRDFKFAIARVQREALSAGFKVEECMWLAWEGVKKDGIKYRIGLMVCGKFVKWDNLDHIQRIEVAKSGQLSNDYMNIEHCKSFCSDSEWAEIMAAAVIS